MPDVIVSRTVWRDPLEVTSVGSPARRAITRGA
jgi:hypothetical protein